MNLLSMKPYDTREDRIRLSAATAHGFISGLVGLGCFPEHHKQRAEEIADELAEAIWPGDERMKLNEHPRERRSGSPSDAR
jgi:hypothetical protein